MTSAELLDLVSTNLMALFGFAASNSIALLSLLVAVLVWWQSRKDAKLAKETAVMSVKPLLSISTYSDFDDHFYGVKFKNIGLGPAIVEEFKVFLDGNEIKGELYKSDIFIALENLEFGKYQIGYGRFMKGQSITAADISPIFDIQFDEEPIDSKVVIDKILRLDFFIKYRDMYGNLQESFDTRINRHLIFN